MGVNQKNVTQKKNIPFRNKGLALKNAASQRAFKQNMAVRKLSSGVNSLRILKKRGAKETGVKQGLRVMHFQLDSVLLRYDAVSLDK